jgi:oligosaccharide translocation protein RFT1
MRDDNGGGASASAARQAAHGTLWGIALKLLSFMLSQCTIRLVDPVLLGKAAIQLDLMLSSILFLSREGFRLALTRGGGTSTSSSGSDSNSGSQNKSESNDNRDGTHHSTQQQPDPHAIAGDVTDDGDQQQEVINVAWLTVPVGMVLSLVALAVHLQSCEREQMRILEKQQSTQQREEEEWNDFRIAGCLYCFSAAIESLAEPMVILFALREMDVKTRATAEAAAALCKAVVTVVLLSSTTGSGGDSTTGSQSMLDWVQRYPVTVFGIGQLVHSFVLCLVYYHQKWKVLRWPSVSFKKWSSAGLSSSTILDIALLKLVGIFTVQGLFKHALTEGDRIVLTTLAAGYDQGVYAMAQSYGGIASRVLLQPLEENARLLFSKQHRLIQKTSKQKADSDAKKSLQQTLCLLVKLVLYIGLVFACLATNYTTTLLQLLAGPKWGANQEAAQVLSAFCCYTALMALNGTTEAFVYGVAQSGGEISRLGVAHAVVGGVFAVLAPLFVKEYGTIGLVAANGICMVLRSLYSLSFAAVYFVKDSTGTSSSTTHTKNSLNADDNKKPSHAEAGHQFSALWLEFQRLVRAMAPHPAALAAFTISYLVTRQSSNYHHLILIDGGRKASLVSSLQHILAGAICFLAVVVVTFRSDRDFLRSIQNLTSTRLKRD